MAAEPRYIASAQTAQETPLPTITPLLRVTQPLLSNGCFSGSTIFALCKYATISIIICAGDSDFTVGRTNYKRGILFTVRNLCAEKREASMNKIRVLRLKNKHFTANQNFFSTPHNSPDWK
jgi:hypothetical protein